MQRRPLPDHKAYLKAPRPRATMLVLTLLSIASVTPIAAQATDISSGVTTGVGVNAGVAGVNANLDAGSSTDVNGDNVTDSRDADSSVNMRGDTKKNSGPTVDVIRSTSRGQQVIDGRDEIRNGRAVDSTLRSGSGVTPNTVPRTGVTSGLRSDSRANLRSDSRPAGAKASTSVGSKTTLPAGNVGGSVTGSGTVGSGGSIGSGAGSSHQ